MEQTSFRKDLKPSVRPFSATKRSASSSPLAFP